MAQEVIGYLMQEIPSLAPRPTFLSASAPPPFSHPTPSHAPSVSATRPPQSSYTSHYTQQPPSAADAPPLIPASVYPSLLPQAGAASAYLQPQPLPGVGDLLGAHLPPPPVDPSHPQLVALRNQVQQLQARGYSQELSQTQASNNFQDTRQQVNSVSLDSLLSATVKFKQYYAIDFAKLSSFPYISQLQTSNMNLALFSYSSTKLLLSLSNGTLQPVSKEEFNARLQHILNVLEITCLGSALSDFDSPSWKVAREYDQKIVKNIEEGYKTWETLDKCIDPTSWTYARELVPKTKNDQNFNKNQGGSTQKVCTTWNTFRNQGCSYEFNNPGERCVYLHVCSKCKQKGFPNRQHQLINC